MMCCQRWSLVLTLGVLMCVVKFGDAVYVSQPDWDAYKSAFNKAYPTASGITESYARYYYAYNMRLIDNHNTQYERGLYSYRLRHNQFTDMRLIHFNALFPQTTQPTTSNDSDLPTAPTTATPDTFDPIEELGLVPNVQNQGLNCSSGWAYATATAVELLQGVQMGNVKPAPLSAQNLIDCAGGTKACSGQVSQQAFDYLAVYGMDLHLESNYNNNNASAEPGMCVPDQSSVVLTTNLAAYARIEDGDDDTMKTYVAANYPVVIEFDPTSFEFMHYSDGIFTQPRTSSGSHYMTVIGYGVNSTTNESYWLVQNSFGKEWGEDGFIRIARNTASPLAKSAILPTEFA